MSGQSQVTVLNPQGFPPKIEQLGMAPRLDSLEGKTIYLVDARFDDGDVLMQQMAAWFSEKMPGVHVELRRKSGVYTQDDKELYDEIKAQGDAMVLGVGH